MEVIILSLIKLLSMIVYLVPLVKLATKEAFLAFKEDARRVSIVQTLKIQMFNKHVQRETFVLKECKHFQNALLVTISHSNINQLALNVPLDSFAHRVALQYL